MIANKGGGRVVKEDEGWIALKKEEDRFKGSKGEGRWVEVDEGRIACGEGGRQVRSFEEDGMKMVGKK